MFLLVTGASGVGKTTARLRVRAELSELVTCVELCQVVAIPDAPDEAWRQRVVGQLVDLALDHQRDGRHLMLCGDPVPASEVFATPRADELEGGAVLLLDADPAVQTRRLAQRGDDPQLLHRHLAFQDLLRRATPRDVAARPGWSYTSVDTTALDLDEVAHHVLSWVRETLSDVGADEAPSTPS